MRGAVPQLAEVNDITQNVYDGIDQFILSVETAKGQFFQETIMSVKFIIEEAEKQIDYAKRYIDQ